MTHLTRARPSAAFALAAVPAHRCAACGATGGTPLVELRNVPSNSCLMLPMAAAARAWPRGDISLVMCEACGFIANRSFAPHLTEYSERYEPSQAWSPAFRRHHRALAERLAAILGPDARRILEVGCGQGEFLHLLCGLTGATGIGFDPCIDAGRSAVVEQRASGVELVARVFDDAVAQSQKADLLVCKMTLEHIPAVGHFAGLCAQVARNSAPGMLIFIQVPDSMRILRDIAFEDIYYEHCCYFTQVSLSGLFARHGFSVEAIWRDYEGQYLGLVARHTDASDSSDRRTKMAELRQAAAGFATRHAARLEEWRRLLRGAGRAAIWGSGSKGVAFLAALGSAAEAVTHVVDINPNRQGMHMIGTGHPIVAPDALRDVRPDSVVVMNRVYREEIGALLSDLGLAPRLLFL